MRRERFLPYAHQAVEEADIQAVVRVLRSDWLTTGPEVEQFEAELADAVGARVAVAFTSATAALHASVAAAGVGPGDEGITTPLTFCATANCLLFQGARPVFADVEDATLTVDPAQIDRRLTHKTKVIIPMDYGGHPAELETIRALARRRGLLVIEDACHALGARYRGKPVGSWSDITVFSFHPVKHITTGEGGMAVTNDFTLGKRLRRFRNHGIVRLSRDQIKRPWFYQVRELGYNYRIPDILCALGRSQLSRLVMNLARRHAIAARYTEAFRAWPGIRTPRVKPGVNPAWHLYPIRVQPTGAGVSRDTVVERLRQDSIGTSVHYIPLPWHPWYRKHLGIKRGEYPVAESAFRQLVSLPLFHGMSDQDVDDVIQAMSRILGRPTRRASRIRSAATTNGNPR